MGQLAERVPVVQRKPQPVAKRSPTSELHPRSTAGPQSGGAVAGRVASPVSEVVGGLPGRLRAGVEGLSGIAMDDVRVHRNSSEPPKLGALAFTRGTEIHLGPGQEKHLPHEAWHVVQQKQGRVQATTQLKGAAVNDDAGLEREADQASTKLAGPRLDHSRPLRFVGISARVLQRQKPTIGNILLDKPEEAGARRVELTVEGGKWKEVHDARTAPVRTAKGSYDFVVFEDGRIFAVRSSSKFGHTEAAAGGRVVWAGQISFTQSGQLKVWTNESGHYLPQGGFAQNATLANKNLDINKYRAAASGSVLRPAVPGGRPAHREGPQLPVIQPETKPPAPTAKIESHAPTAPQEPARVTTTSPSQAKLEQTSKSQAARDVAREMAEMQSSTRWMARVTEWARAGLTVWSAIDALETAAKALNMSAATLAHGSPFQQEINAANNIEMKAKEIQDYYADLAIIVHMPQTVDIEWSSQYELYQKQVMYILVDQDLEQALKSAKAAKSNLDAQLGSLQDGMNQRIRAATFLPMTSLVYADLILFADAARIMLPRLRSARDSYEDVQRPIEFKRRMAGAAIKRVGARIDQLENARLVGWTLRQWGVRSEVAERISEHMRAMPLR